MKARYNGGGWVDDYKSNTYQLTIGKVYEVTLCPDNTYYLKGDNGTGLYDWPKFFSVVPDNYEPDIPLEAKSIFQVVRLWDARADRLVVWSDETFLIANNQNESIDTEGDETIYTLTQLLFRYIRQNNVKLPVAYEWESVTK